MTNILRLMFLGNLKKTATLPEDSKQLINLRVTRKEGPFCDLKNNFIIKRNCEENTYYYSLPSQKTQTSNKFYTF